MWQQAFAILLMAAAGGAMLSAGTGPLAQNFSQSLQNVGSLSRQVFDGAQTYISHAERDTVLRNELARYITPYSLKVNKYLNKYEMVDYFLESGKAYEFVGQMNKALT